MACAGIIQRGSGAYKIYLALAWIAAVKCSLCQELHVALLHYSVSYAGCLSAPAHLPPFWHATHYMRCHLVFLIAPAATPPRALLHALIRS